MASWTDGPATLPEERSLDAHTCKVLGQGNADAVYEQALQNYCLILPAEVLDAAGWYGGPYPIPMRLGRDGEWRTPLISPLAGGAGNPRTIRGYLLKTWYEPDADRDPYQDWPMADTTDVKWNTAAEITVPVGWEPATRRFPSGDEDGEVRIAWLVFDWTQTSASGRFAGFHLSEQL